MQENKLLRDIQAAIRETKVPRSSLFESHGTDTIFQWHRTYSRNINRILPPYRRSGTVPTPNASNMLKPVVSITSFSEGLACVPNPLYSYPLSSCFQQAIVSVISLHIPVPERQVLNVCHEKELIGFRRQVERDTL